MSSGRDAGERQRPSSGMTGGEPLQQQPMLRLQKRPETAAATTEAETEAKFVRPPRNIDPKMSVGAAASARGKAKERSVFRSVSSAASAGALPAFLAASAARESAREADAKHMSAQKRAKHYRIRHRLRPKPPDDLISTDSELLGIS